MKAFNLNEALAGVKVITRDGREVTQMKFFKDVNINLIVGVVNKNIWSWDMDGKFNSLHGDSDKDLFMAIKKKSVWVNVYEDKFSDEFTIGIQHKTLEIATNNIRGNEDYIKTIEITNEPE